LPSLKKLTKRVQYAAKKGFLKGIDGRKIYIRSEHAALNSLLQGGGAILMKQALVLLDNKIKQNKIDATFVANIHDEWQIQVKENQADLVGQLGVEALKEAGDYFNLRCPLAGQYKIGDNWSETH
jgi:DNA polymerase-1